MNLTCSSVCIAPRTWALTARGPGTINQSNVTFEAFLRSLPSPSRGQAVLANLARVFVNGKAIGLGESGQVFQLHRHALMPGQPFLMPQEIRSHGPIETSQTSGMLREPLLHQRQHPADEAFGGRDGWSWQSTRHGRTFMSASGDGPTALARWTDRRPRAGPAR